MTEVPVLHLGLAGFSEAQQKIAAAALLAAAGPAAAWTLSPLDEADMWWIEGSRTMPLQGGMVRVQPGLPTGRSMQISLSDVDRPVAFTLPAPPQAVGRSAAFELLQREQAVAVLAKCAAYLQPALDRFCLAASLSVNEPDLQAGAWEVVRGMELLATVDVRLGVAVARGVTAADFEGANWRRRDAGSGAVPADFGRASIAQVMWQYACRSQRDLLPAHYRGRPLYFRRPPRLPHRELGDAHLLLLRELSARPGLDFAELSQSTGLAEGPLARHLAALYMVGSITSNPKRVVGGSVPRQVRTPDAQASSLFAASELATTAETGTVERPVHDLTAPAPLLPA